MPDPTKRETPKPGRNRARPQESLGDVDTADTVLQRMLDTLEASPERAAAIAEFQVHSRALEARSRAALEALAGWAKATSLGAGKSVPAGGTRFVVEEVGRPLSEWDDPDVVAELEAVDELLAETDRALESAARHGDRTEALLEQIRRARAETVV